MPDPTLQVEKLTHSYDSHHALRGLTLSVEQGEIFGFLGPNGSGKTTLFRILSTLIPPQSGLVRYHFPDSQPLDLPRDQTDVRRHIGVVFQSPSLDKQLTAEENLRHHAHLYGLRGPDLQSRIRDLLSRVGLADRPHERVGAFSGGMRRRVELAKGMLTRPRVLLLDEPSTGLDPAARIDLWRYLKDIQQNDGVTILLTTHLMDEGDRCSRLAVMNRGELAACDTPDALKSRIGGDIITLSTPKPAELRDAIRQRFNADAAQVDESDQFLRIERPRGHEFIPQLIEAFPGAIDSVSVGKPTLEDVFIRLTGHRLLDHRERESPPAAQKKATR